MAQTLALRMAQGDDTQQQQPPAIDAPTVEVLTDARCQETLQTEPSTGHWVPK